LKHAPGTFASFLDVKHLYIKQMKEDLSGVHLWLLLWKAGKTIESQAHRSVEAMGLGLSDFGVLEALLHKGPLPVNALGKKVLLTSGSMTAAIDRLEKCGLVEREFDVTDRRTRIVHLTAKGKDLIRKLFGEHERDMERAFSHLNEGERRSLAGLLRKLGRAEQELTKEKRR
jgi:MarR family transcriptional regulator, 2-MHQ and catechol-resistance regulon repressor